MKIVDIKSFGFRFQMHSIHSSTEGFCAIKTTQTENHFGLNIFKILIILVLLPSLLLHGQFTKVSTNQKRSVVVTAEKGRASGGVINNNAKIIVGSGAGMIVNGNYTSESSGLATLSGTGSLKLTGDFINNNTSGNPLVAASTGSVVFNGTIAQTIGGTAASTTFYGMTINNSAGILLSKNAVTEKDLLFSAGKLNVQSSNFMFGTNAVASGFDATKYIIATGSGTVSKKAGGVGSFTLPLAENTVTEEYSPLTFNFASGTFTNAIVTGNVVDAKHSSTSTTANLSRYWNISQSGITGFSCTVTGTYKDADITGSEAHIWSGFYNGSTIANFTKANAGANSVSATLTSFGTNGAFTGNLGNNLPVVTSTALTSAVQGTLYSYTLTATDADADAMTYSAPVLLGWLSFNTTTRVLSGTPTQTEVNVGSYSVTLRVNDGYGDTDQIFTINVTNVNDAPTISNILDTVTDEDTAKLINFTIADIDNPVANLTLTATSSNTTLVPVANIVFGGSGADRTATITPAANQNGTSTITITVSDGVKRSSFVLKDINSKNTKKDLLALSNDSKATASDAFVLTVNSINDAPVCNVNPAISGSSYLGAVISGTNGTWSDIDLPTQTISYTYQWQRADNSGFTVNVVDIASATTINYTLTAADQSKYLRLKVTGKDNGTPNMSATAISNVLIITIPTLSGIKTVGTGGDYTTLNGTNGLFSAINGSIITGNITAKITSNLAETSFTQLGQWSESGTGNYRLRIIPDATTARTITGTQALILFVNGADRLTIDGTINKLLTFDNSNNGSGSVMVFKFENSDNDSILNCTIKSANPNASLITAVDIGDCNGMVFAKNKISGLNGGASAEITGLSCSGSSTSVNHDISISNNMITLLPTTTGEVKGVEYAGSGTTVFKLYYNSVYIGGVQSGSNKSYAFGKESSHLNFYIRDNIFYNARTNAAKAGTGKHYASYIYLFGGTTSQNYNLLYSANGTIGRTGSTECATLANWQSATGLDLNSQSSSLSFEDYTTGDLRFKREAANSAVFDKGTPVAGITDDYLSKSRTSLFYSQVDIGAYELPQSSDIDDGLLPIVTALSQNFPNPFNPATEINFSLAKDSKVNLTVYNAKGEIVRTLLNTSLNAGYHSVNFNAAGLNSGVYIYKMITQENSFTRKMIIVK